MRAPRTRRPAPPPPRLGGACTATTLLALARRRCVGAFIWWAWGHGTAYPEGTNDCNSHVDVDAPPCDGNPFIGLPGASTGSSGWVGSNESASGADFASWWFQCTPPARPAPTPPSPRPRPL